jgi:8-hydroxy-5-deazaflavin:NADPH oxidoreductase
MKIGILGATKMATTLGNKMLSAGCEVTFGVREDFEAKEIEWKILNMYLDKVFGYLEVIERSDIILICCENEHLPKVCHSLEYADLTEKTIVDCTNGSFGKVFSYNTPLIQKFLNGKEVFKAFNNLGLDYPKSDLLGLIKETFYCGEDGPEKMKVKRVIELCGFKAIDAGEIESALLLEAFYHLRKEIACHKREKTDFHFRLISV